jgi:hypothetical protein
MKLLALSKILAKRQEKLKKPVPRTSTSTSAQHTTSLSSHREK